MKCQVSRLGTNYVCKQHHLQTSSNTQPDSKWSFRVTPYHEGVFTRRPAVAPYASVVAFVTRRLFRFRKPTFLLDFCASVRRQEGAKCSTDVAASCPWGWARNPSGHPMCIVSPNSRYLIFHGSSVRDQLFEFAVPRCQKCRFHTKPTNMGAPTSECNILSTRAFQKVQCNPSNPLSYQGEDPSISPASMPPHFRCMDNGPWTASTRY
jgi:hypothetical protein